MVIDTPGIDDEGALGELRVRKTRQILNKIDAAVLVVDGTGEPAEADRELIRLFQEKQIPFLVAVNKADAAKEEILEEKFGEYENRLIVSGKTGFQIQELKEKIANLAAVQPSQRRIVGDLLKPGDTAVLVVPIDQAAPKGRLILPQQQTIRDILEADAAALVVKENGLKEALKSLGKKPALVITDSQVFGTVSADTPKDIPLTSFSILFARYKGNLQTVVRGAAAIKSLQQGDRVLISEGCTHHRQCEDIGSVKLPRWLKEYTKKELSIELTSGTEFPEDLSPYRLIIHCGGCMLNEREMKYRLKCAEDQGIPMTNYGIAIACMQGILRRSVELFPQVLAELQQEEV